jgi:hypothetical protein
MQTTRLPLKQRLTTILFNLFVATITSTPGLFILSTAACIALFIQPITQDLLFQLKHRISSLRNNIRYAREQKLNLLSTETENPDSLLPPPMEQSKNDRQ